MNGILAFHKIRQIENIPKNGASNGDSEEKQIQLRNTREKARDKGKVSESVKKNNKGKMTIKSDNEKYKTNV